MVNGDGRRGHELMLMTVLCDCVGTERLDKSGSCRVQVG
jgi:hypothetical protein